MKQRKLGPLTVSEIGLGCMGFVQSYPPFPTQAEAISLIHKAIGLGFTFLTRPRSTAPIATRSSWERLFKPTATRS